MAFELLVLQCYLKNSKSTKELKGTSCFKFKKYCVRCYVALSNVFELFWDSAYARMDAYVAPTIDIDHSYHIKAI